MYWIEETVLIASLALGLSVYIMILHAIHFCDVVGVDRSIWQVLFWLIIEGCQSVSLKRASIIIAIECVLGFYFWLIRYVLLSHKG